MNQTHLAIMIAVGIGLSFILGYKMGDFIHNERPTDFQVEGKSALFVEYSKSLNKYNVIIKNKDLVKIEEPLELFPDKDSEEKKEANKL